MSPLSLAAGAACALLLAPAQEGPRLEWDESTLTLVRAGGNYARMVRLPGRDILCGYDRGGRIHVLFSRDHGRTWGGETLVFAPEGGAATNTELLVLRNGWILLPFNERPEEKTRRFAIRTCLSRDGGKSWSAPSTVYEADTAFENGCWEPAAVQLPSGEIQLFFANENPYRNSSEQEITLVRSLDNAATWSAPTRVSFRAGHRDGMPVPLVLGGGKGVVLAIEDNGLCGTFKPVIVSVPQGDSGKTWVDGTSPRRWGALKAPLLPATYAGAPYLRQLPGGETVLSFQCSEGRPKPRMVACLGDEDARGFSAPSVPFKVPADRGCFWNSLFVKDASTVTAVSGTQPEGQTVQGIWAIDGRVVRRP